METFNEWFEENKNSDILKEEYREYVNDCFISGFHPHPFEKWSKKQYNFEHNI
jgi:hypothetical protein